MPRIPGMKANVYFGGVDSPDIDWTSKIPPDFNADDDEQPLTSKDKEYLKAVLGFDPAEGGDDASEE